MRQCRIWSATLSGVEAIPVMVEVSVSDGMPGMRIVGMGDTAVQEAGERVRAAIRASGFLMPTEKIVVNLAPADLKKNGSGFDLAIAIGILAATGQVNGALLRDGLFVGELSLQGEVRESPGALAYGMCAASIGCSFVSAGEYELPIGGLKQIHLESLASLCDPDILEAAPRKMSDDRDSQSMLDFRDIAGHETAKRALQIAAAGNLGVLMSGTPGSGKTMLASRLPSILSDLSEREKIESAIIHSVASEPIDSIIKGSRPFRNPHHSATVAGMLGGGSPVQPGEVTLAHNGVLFLDELAEFKSSVLQGLRQPMETGEVVITRATGTTKMPASFMLVAATNPCPCGYFGSDKHACSCTEAQISRYQGRVGGPLIDRFNIQIDVARLPSKEILASGSGTSSEKLKDGVCLAREFRDFRRKNSKTAGFGGLPSISELTKIKEISRSLSTEQLLEECCLNSSSTDFLTGFADSENLSGRSIVSILKIARTIADIEESLEVEEEHLAEAMGFRVSETFGGIR